MKACKLTKTELLDILICVVEFALVLTIIYDGNTVYRQMRVPVPTRLVSMLSGIVWAFVLIILFVKKNNENLSIIKHYKFMFLISFAFTMIFYVLNVVKTDNVGYIGYFLFFMNLMTVLFKIYKSNGNTFRLFYLFEHVMLVIAVISVILWFGSNVLDLWGMNKDVFVDWGGRYYNTNYLNFCIRRWMELYNFDVTKNLGIFVEPPMYGLMLGIALYVELFLKKKTNLLIVFVFLVTLGTSQATVAILVAIAGMFFKFMEMIEGRKYAKLLAVIVIVGAIAAGTGALAFKLSSVSGGSIKTHLDDFAAALKCWTHYPILGCGYNFEDPIVEFMSDFRKDNLGLSNSGAVVLAEGGIVLWTYYVLPFVIMLSGFFKKNKKLAYWAAGTFAFWIAVIFHTRLMIFVLLSMGYSFVDINCERDKETKKYKFAFSINRPCDNLASEKGFFERHPFKIPAAFRIVMMTILGVVSVYSIANIDEMDTGSIICDFVVLIGIGILVFLNTKGRRLSEYVNIAIEIGIWLVYMVVGSLYQVLDSFYKATGMYMQDTWWLSIVVVIGLYIVGCFTDKLYMRMRVAA